MLEGIRGWLLYKLDLYASHNRLVWCKFMRQAAVKHLGTGDTSCGGQEGCLLTSEEMIPVAANDIAFSIHAAVLLTTFTLFQISIYDRGSQKVSRISIGIVSVVWLSAAVCFFTALPSLALANLCF